MAPVAAVSPVGIRLPSVRRAAPSRLGGNSYGKAHNVNRMITRRRPDQHIARRTLTPLPAKATDKLAPSTTEVDNPTVPQPYLKCINAFRDSWALIKGSEEISLEFADINKYLIGIRPEAVMPQDVRQLIDEEGYTLVDVRIGWSHNEWHIEEAVHMPLQRQIKGKSPPKLWRTFGHMLFVEFPATEANFPNWLEDMRARFDLDDKLLISCDLGGLLDEEPSKCVTSTSYEGIYLLHQCGFKNLKYIKGGYCAWRNNEELVKQTKGVRVNMPWYKTTPVVKEFFPAPCGWTHVRRCEDCDSL